MELQLTFLFDTYYFKPKFILAGAVFLGYGSLGFIPTSPFKFASDEAWSSAYLACMYSNISLAVYF